MASGSKKEKFCFWGYSLEMGWYRWSNIFPLDTLYLVCLGLHKTEPPQITSGELFSVANPIEDSSCNRYAEVCCSHKQCVLPVGMQKFL